MKFVAILKNFLVPSYFFYTIALMFAALFSTIDSDTLILTANKRLSMRIASEYYQYQVKQQKTAWETLNILPFNSWLQCLWEQYALQNDAPILLHPLQEQYIWQQIIAQTATANLLNLSSTTQQVQAAWQLIKQWNLNLEDAALQQTQAGKIFTQWAQKFSAQCKHNQWVDQASLLECMQSQIINNRLAIPKTIILIGYLELTPAMQTFVNQLAKQKNITPYPAPSSIPQKSISNFKGYQFCAPDTETEIQIMARWAKQLYDNDKNIKVGCIIPTLTELRSKLERIFNAIFGAHKFYNIASGTPLIQEPLIEIAIDSLKLIPATLPLETIGHILRSPFIGGSEEENSSRALLDRDLRKLGNTHYSLTSLLKIFPLKKLTACPLFLNKLNQLSQLKFPNQQLPSQWIILFSEILTIMGWPGDRALNSREYQTQQHWQKILIEFNTLDLLNKNYTFTQALELLQRSLTQTLFQTQSQDTPIQILGLLEAIGQPFTHTWIMGLDSQHFPAAPNPNPFIPAALQRQFKMPHANAERELEYAQLLLTQFTSDSSNIIFSYAKNNGDQLLEPSNLIEAFPNIELEDLPLALYKNPAEQLFNIKTIKMIVDQQAPAITTQENTQGGTNIFKYQAACPFRAFAQFRLQAETLETCQLGFNQLERGALLHNVLELIWKEIKTQAQLLKLPEEKLTEIIEANIQTAIKQIFSLKQTPESFIELEKQCLKKILTRWMQIEKEREPFEVIACEQWQNTKIGKLTIRMKIDRIDKLAQDQYILIDYKSGNTEIKSWFGDRPEEPQLPLYLITAKQPIQAITFVQLTPKKIGFNGISYQKNLLPGIKTLEEIKNTFNWQEQYIQWEKTLMQLADDFCKGYAIVDPKDKNQSCKYCSLQTLCRIYENNEL